MIDEKKIEKAAKQRVNAFRKANPNGYSTIIVDIESDCMDNFKAGVSWALQEFKKSLWHDASEEPQEDVHLLVEEDFDAGSNLGMYYNIYEYDESYESWKVRVSERRVHRWLYIDDLLPKKGGEE